MYNNEDNKTTLVGQDQNGKSHDPAPYQSPINSV